MLKKLLLVGLVAASCGANAAVIYNNGPVVVGAAPTGISTIRAGGTLFGLGDQAALGNSVADDFTIGALATWNIETIDFYAYQTTATVFPFTSATWSIVSGNVNTGTVLASGVTALTSGGQQGFRVSSTAPNDTNRRIYQATADIPNISLGAGSYFLRWGLTGNAALSGPWQPPTSDGALGNAYQSISNGTYNLAVDAGDGLGVTLPFTLNGTITVIPEPAPLALMLAGGLVVAGAARRRSAG